MSTSWKIVCMDCQKVSQNPHPRFTPVLLEELFLFIRKHHDSCGQDFKVINEYQANYDFDCDQEHYHTELEKAGGEG